MARIAPVPDPSVRTEGLPTPYQRPFATPEGEGAGFGTVLQGAAHVASGFVQDAREKADAANIQGAWGQGQDLLNKTILDPEKGYSSLRGSDAMAGREKALSTFNKGLDEITKGLTPQQQQMFEPHARALREQGYTHVISHEAHEQESYAQANFKGNVDATMETMQQPSIVASPDDLKAQTEKLFQAGIEEGKRRFGANASKEAILSVVDPMLQQASLGGMQAALVQAEQAGDPTIAKNAYDVLGKYLLKNHQKQIGGMVEALTAKAAIQQGAQSIIGGATDSVALPDGGQIARIDAGKLAQGVANLKDDTPHLSEIQDTVEKKQARLGRLWDAAVGKVYQRVEGDALKGGGFDLDRASAVDKEWLRVNAPDLLDKLQTKDTRGDRTERALADSEAWSALAADIAAHPDVYKERSVPEFVKLSAEMGVGPLNRIKALKLFEDVQKAGQSEKINKTVSEQLLNAFPGGSGSSNAKRREQLQGMLLDAASDFAERWKAETQGKVVPTEKLRQFVDSELVKGKVVGSSGRFWPDDTATRIEYQKNPKYQGKGFTPTDPTVSAIPQTPGATTVQAATPVVPAPQAPVRQPPFPGAVHVTNGKQGGWLPANKPIPAGWRAD